MPQPIRICRLSDGDLYWVAMKMRRKPELMQLLSEKSMMRYGPPKYTAGFARSFVKGYSRSPTPPARTITSVFSIRDSHSSEPRNGGGEGAAWWGGGAAKGR